MSMAMDDKAFQTKLLILDRADEIRERAEHSASLEERRAVCPFYPQWGSVRLSKPQ